MQDYVIASNSDDRVEAFYIDDNGTVVHTWQLDPSDKTKWSAAIPLTNQKGGKALTGATRVEACTNENASTRSNAPNASFAPLFKIF